jgi:hypothetical protein
MQPHEPSVAPRKIPSGPKVPRRFELRRELGRGAFGTVWAAFDKERSQLVALKTLHRINPSILFRFKQEFRALADIRHPNLIALHELIAADDLWFFTMDLVEGIDFRHYVRGDERAEVGISLVDTTGPVSLPSVQELVASTASPHTTAKVDEDRLRQATSQLASGLIALHGEGKMHCDLKPSNVFVTAEGRVIIMDFGLVSDVGETQGGHGTPGYMSPEQINGTKITAASDWYSLGVMLYEVMVGQRPHQGKTSMELFTAKLKVVPVHPQSVVAGLPDDLAGLTMQLLQKDPTKRPSGQEILDCMGVDAKRTSVVPYVIQGSLLVGRKEQLDALADSFRAVRAGTPTIVRVLGRSGLGKSAIINRFLEIVHYDAKPPVILRGRCYEQESVPFKALDSLVDSLTRYLSTLSDSEVGKHLPAKIGALSQIFPVLLQVEEINEEAKRAQWIENKRELRMRAFQALRELLGNIAATRPVIVYIDDLQWGDVDSAQFLRDFFEPPHVAPILLIENFRDEDQERNEVLAILRKPSYYSDIQIDLREIKITPLSDEECKALALALLGGVTNPTAEREAQAIAKECVGNPYFVHELVQYIQAVGGSVESKGELRLDSVLSKRIARLSPSAQLLLRTAAVAGVPTALEIVQKVSGLTGSAFYDSLSALRSAHLVRTQGLRGKDRIECYHHRIRESVVQDLSEEMRREEHIKFATVLEASGEADPEALTVHFKATGDTARTAKYALLAAHRAAHTLAFARAAELYQLALDLKPCLDEPELRHDLLRKLAEALTSAGRLAQGAEVRLGLAKEVPRLESLNLKRLAAEMLLCSGRSDKGFDTFREVLGNLGIRVPVSPLAVILSVLLARITLALRGLKFKERAATDADPIDLVRIDAITSAGLGFSLTDTVRGAYLQTTGFLIALRTGDIFRLAHALSFEVSYTSIGGVKSAPKARKLMTILSSLADRVDHPRILAGKHYALGFSAFMVGDWKTAKENFSQSEVLLRDRCTGELASLNTIRNMLYRSLIWRGEFVELAERVPAVLREADEIGDHYAGVNLRGLPMTVLGFMANKPEQVELDLERATRNLSTQRFIMPHLYILLSYTLLDLYMGRPLEAYQRLTEKWRTIKRSMLLRVESLLVTTLDIRVRVALAAGIAGATERFSEADRVITSLERKQAGWSNALAMMFRGALAASQGQREQAIQHFSSAAPALDALGMGLHAAVSRLRLGQLQPGGEGEELRSQALEWFKGQNVILPERFADVFCPMARTEQASP